MGYQRRLLMLLILFFGVLNFGLFTVSASITVEYELKARTHVEFVLVGRHEVELLVKSNVPWQISLEYGELQHKVWYRFDSADEWAAWNEPLIISGDQIGCIPILIEIKIEDSYQALLRDNLLVLPVTQ